MGSFFISIIVYGVILGVLLVLTHLIPAAVAQKRYADSWSANKVATIFDGCINIGIGLCLILEDGRAGIVRFISNTFELRYDASDTLYSMFLYIGIFSLIVGIIILCRSFFETLIGYRGTAESLKSNLQSEGDNKDSAEKIVEGNYTEGYTCTQCGTKLFCGQKQCPNCKKELNWTKILYGEER